MGGAAVSDLEFGAADLALLVRACAHVRLSECTPCWLKPFLVGRLLQAGTFDLASRVTVLDQDRVAALCKYIKEQQSGDLPRQQ
jgi:hypothetical protein